MEQHSTIHLTTPDVVKGIEKIELEPLQSDDFSTATITLYQYGGRRYISIPALHIHAPTLSSAIAVCMHIRCYLHAYYCDELGQVHLKHKDNVFVQKLLEASHINEFEISRESLFIRNWNNVLATGMDTNISVEEREFYCEQPAIVNV